MTPDPLWPLTNTQTKRIAVLAAIFLLIGFGYALTH